MINEIFDFNKTVIGVNVTSVTPLTDKEFEWLEKAILEELTEMIAAHDTRDVAGFVDGVLDLVYFSVGALCRMGLTTEQAYACFHAIHSANMTKKKGKQEKRGDFADDAIKPEDFVPPETVIKRILGL